MLASQLVRSPDDAAEIVELLKAVNEEVASELGNHESWTERHHSAYLTSVTKARVALGHKLTEQLRYLIEVASSSPKSTDLRDATTPIGQMAERLAEGVGARI
jgi:hypothetical protein